MEAIMRKVRIEMHLSDQETKLLDKIAKQENRSRKNLCETEIRKIIQSFLEEEKKKQVLFIDKLLLEPALVSTGNLNEGTD